MVSYAPQLAEYFRYSNRFYYLTIDLGGKLTYVNPVFQDQFKFLSTGADNSQSNSIIFGENQISQVLQHCIQHPYIPVTTQVKINAANGHSKTIQWEFSSIIDQDGKTTAIQAVGMNVSDYNVHAPVVDKLEELRYQAAMLENVSDIIASSDLQQRVKSWNKQAEIFYNIKAVDAIGRRITDVVKLDYSPTTRELAHKELYETGKWKGEVSYLHPNGERKYLLNSLSFVYNDEGERIGLMATGKDITDIRNAQEELIQSELFYRNLFVESLDGILLADENADLQFCSTSVTTILGYTSAELIGKNAFDFVHPDDKELAITSFQNELTGLPELRTTPITIRLQKKDHEYLWCLVRGHNLLSNPYVGRMAIYFCDDSLRKHAEDALKETEKRFRQLTSDLKFGVIIRDAEGRPILCNKTVLEFTGMTEKEFMQTSIETIGVNFFDEDGHELKMSEHPYYRARATKKPVRDVVLRATSKTRKNFSWLLVSSDPVLNDDGELMHVINTFMNITERKKLEEKLIREKLKKQKVIIKAQEKERKEIGKELHDNIGQQLTTAKLYLDIARENVSDETLKLVNQAAKSISDIISEVRGLSRALTPSSLSDIGLIESVKDLCGSIRTTQAFGIRFYHKHFDETRLDEDLKLMIFRIIQEQINNIIKHADASAILIRLQTDAEHLTLTIADNGKGFNSTTTKKGLGLDNMANRAEVFNGKFDLKSEVEKGCSIVVTVPLEKDWNI
jgi:PAS domain S-box-containing protein